MSSKDGSIDRSAFSVREILAGEAPKETPVTVKGWVRTRRDSKAGISFVHLSDGSSFHPLQAVAPSTMANYTDDVLKLTAGCAVEATGTIVSSVGGLANAALIMSSIYIIGLIVPWFAPETAGKPMPD